MRILTIGNLYPPFHFGGYEQVWHSAVEHLRGREHEVRVLATDYRADDAVDEPIYIKRVLRWYWHDHDFDRVPRLERLRIERHNHRVLTRELRQLRPDAVAFWAMGGMSHSLIEAVRRQGIPMAAFVHDQWLDYGREFDQWTRMFHRPSGRRLAGLVERVSRVPTAVQYGAAGRYVFVSEFIRRRALRLGLGLVDTAVAHSGIDPGFIGPLPAERQFAWNLLYVGRLHPDKGIHQATDALAFLPPAATLTFVGTWDPREESALIERIRSHGLADRVRLLGHRPPLEIASLMRSHDVLLFPTVWDEPWGLVPIEAMACGCPVVASGRGGSGEYLEDGRNCLLVPGAEPEGLAAAVRRLAESDGLRARLRAGGAQTAPRHTEPIFNASVERHLLEVAGQAVSAEVAMA